MKPTFASAPTKTMDVSGSAFLYRDIGDATGIPVILLNHLTGMLDDWDPAVVDGIADQRRVIIFDNRGVGGSTGETPDNITEMARDATAFIDALGLTTVDLLGFSLGGFISQLIMRDRPDLIRRAILAGTGPAGGAGISKIGSVVKHAIERAAAERRHPKQILFYSQSARSQLAAVEFLARISSRKNDRDLEARNETVTAQITAITNWGNDAGLGPPLHTIKHPVLVANGDNDIMVPTLNSIALFHGLPNATLSIFPDAGHGGVFQYHREFVSQAIQFFGRGAASP